MADRFSISLRTLYRDMKTLQESGVPIVSEAGTGYSLMDGYRLPPVTFTKEEAIAFLTAEKLVQKLTDTSTYRVYQSALFKIKAVLRNEDKEHIESMNSSIEVVPIPATANKPKADNHLQTILDCIANKQILLLDYFANHNQQTSSRKVEPVGIFFKGNQWYLLAFCLLRNDYRTFRIDRILKNTKTTEHFQKQHLSLANYLKQLTKEKDKLQRVVIRVDNACMNYLGEQKYYNGIVSEKRSATHTEMTFLCASLEGFARWYIMFGDKAEISTPRALKTRVKELATSISKKN